MPKGEGKVVSQNKKANHDYFIEETYETDLSITRN
ncbi:SsrA-binding protein [Bacillus safensis FO-36b] [Bacillus safensis subsp. safensis]